MNTHNAIPPCEVCGKTFNALRYLNQHKQRTHVSRTFQCKICRKYYGKFALGMHMKRMHSSSGKEFDSNGDRIPQFQCHICKMFIIKKSNLVRHMVAMHGSKLPKMPHICSICGKGYATMPGITNHMASHNNPNPYKFVCNHCGKKYRDKTVFQSHLNVQHLGIRPFKCTDCDKSFGRMSTLQTHKRMHSGVKPHICTVKGCDRAYVYGVDLKRHLWGQHRIYTKKFECQICQKIFPENKLLTKHLKTHPSVDMD